MSSSGDLIKRTYSEFSGVDFSNKEVALYRSPDALNMWKNYKNSKCIETRPDIRLYKELDNTPYGVYFFIINNIEHMIVHCGVSLYDYNTVTNERKIIKATGMNPRKSQAFIFNNIFYIKDGINYLEYDGETCKEVVGYIPTTTTGRAPIGGGTDREDVNVLTPLRKNAFCADGESTEYHLDQREIDNEEVKAWINDVETTDFTVDYVNGVITFGTAPEAPDSVGQDNVVIQFSKATNGHRDRINKCTLLEVFDNRVFFSGNQDYPNQIFNSKLNNPRYISDLDYYNEGMDMIPVRAMITGNNGLWVLKEPSEAKTSIFYHNPALDDNNGKAYPSIHSSITMGCVSTGINFNDDIVFFSERGMEGMNGDVTTEQVVAHRSSLIDNKLLREENYRKLILQEYEGYLMVFIDNKVYLADSRGKYTNVDHVEYEWFYWEIDVVPTCATVHEGKLYLGAKNGIFTLEMLPEYPEIKMTEENGQYYLDGEIKQYTRSGKNLLNVSSEFTVTKVISNISIDMPAGTYILSVDEIITNGEIDKFLFYFYYDDGTTLLKTISSMNKSIRFTTEKAIIKMNIYSQDLSVNSEGITTTYKNAMISTEGGEYEPYGLSPSPDFPSDLNVLYKAGRYITEIDNKKYMIALKEDLRATNKVADRLWINPNNNTSKVEKKVERKEFENVSSLEIPGMKVKGSIMSTVGGTVDNKTVTFSKQTAGELYYELEESIDVEQILIQKPSSHWTSPEDEFSNPQLQKITNKRGCIIDMQGEEITISAKTDNEDFEEINTYTNVKGYVVPRIKKKKWKSIQIKFSSNKPFGLFECTLESYIGAYVKR